MAGLPVDATLSSRPRFQGMGVVAWESAMVDRLLRYKVLEVHWIMKQKVGGRQASCAWGTTIGRILYGS